MKLTRISAATRSFISALAALVLAALLPQAGFAKPPSDSAMWTVNLLKSKSGPNVNTLYIERNSGKATTQGPAASTFLVIYNGNAYLATAADSDVSFSNGVKTVDYMRWRGMRLVQIGKNVQTTDYCGFRCQSGLPDTHRTLTYAPIGVDTMAQMRDVAVLNAR